MLSDRPRQPRSRGRGEVNAVPSGSWRRFSATTEWLAGAAHLDERLESARERGLAAGAFLTAKLIPRVSFALLRNAATVG